MVMVMKRVRTYMIIFVVEIIGVLMFMGCSFKNPQKTSDATSALDLSINPYYDAGYDQGQEGGIMMVSKIYEAILTTTLADIRERKGRSMSWGMKKDMMPVLMMASLIVTVIQRRKSSGFI